MLARPRSTTLGVWSRSCPDPSSLVPALLLLFALLVSSVAALSCVQHPTDAQSTSILTPCGSTFLRPLSSAPRLTEPRTLKASNGILRVTLEVHEHRIQVGVFAFTTRLFCVRDAHDKLDCSLPGPTLKIHAGDTLELTLRNALPRHTDPHADAHSDAHGHHGHRHLPGMGSHFANSDLVNVHTHGLHVDPHVDDVWLQLQPGESHTYVYEVPTDHTPGLAWYHAHVHGAATLHLLQGLLGAIVVLPAPTLTLPAFLRSSAVATHLLVLTHHPLCSCNPTFNMFKVLAIPDIQALAKDTLDTAPEIGSEGISDAYLVNGHWQPQLRDVRVREWRRLDLLNAVPDTFLELELSDRPFARAPQAEHCRLKLLAIDGVYLEQPRDVRYHLMTSGGRASLAFQCDQPGTYYLHSNPRGRAGAPDVSFVQNLLTIHVTSDSSPEHETPDPHWQAGDVSKPLYLQSLFNAEVSTPFELGMFDQNVINGSHWFGIGKNCTSPCAPGMNCSRLDPNEHGECAYHAFQGVGEPLRRASSLCSVEQMTMRARGRTGHPMHIHTVHFQIISARGDDGSPVSASYLHWGELGDWRDTFPALPGVELVVRYALDGFGGILVVHCHTTAHEDGGMMGVIFVDSPESGRDCLVEGGGSTGKPRRFCDCPAYSALTTNPRSIVAECSSYRTDTIAPRLREPSLIETNQEFHSLLGIPLTVLICIVLYACFAWRRYRLSSSPNAVKL